MKKLLKKYLPETKTGSMKQQSETIREYEVWSSRDDDRYPRWVC